MASPLSRRDFLYVNSAALLAAQLPATLAAAESTASGEVAKLAKDGGPKAVTGKPGARIRWDAREKQQLSTAVDQPSLFYWAGRTPNKQTSLFIERFKQYSPHEHVVTCSSGTAALHVAV